jgi:hypothetical protein
VYERCRTPRHIDIFERQEDRRAHRDTNARLRHRDDAHFFKSIDVMRISLMSMRAHRTSQHQKNLKKFVRARVSQASLSRACAPQK